MKKLEFKKKLREFLTDLAGEPFVSMERVKERARQFALENGLVIDAEKKEDEVHTTLVELYKLSLRKKLLVLEALLLSEFVDFLWESHMKNWEQLVESEHPSVATKV